MRKNLLCTFLFCVSCQTQTFLMSQITIPEEEQSFGRDIDQDGVIDNAMPEWSDIWSGLGLSTQENIDALIQSGSFNIGLDLTERLARAELRGYQAYSIPGETFRFDGSDELTEASEAFPFDKAQLAQNSGEASNLRASGQRFVWPMSLFDTLFLLPLEGVEVTGDVLDEKIEGGSISGFIRAQEIADLMPSIPAALDEFALRQASQFHQGGAPVSCEGDIDGVAAVCEAINPTSFCTDRSSDGAITGLCVSLNSQTRIFALAFDANGDGRYTVIQDPATGLFIENELADLFDISGVDEAPTGLFGDLFRLDINNDGQNDAMGVGVGFEAVLSKKAP
jgi:hypothetical protein